MNSNQHDVIGGAQEKQGSPRTQANPSSTRVLAASARPLRRLTSTVSALVTATTITVGCLTAPTAAAAENPTQVSQTERSRAAGVTLQTPPHALVNYKFGLSGRAVGVRTTGKTVLLQERRSGTWRNVDSKQLRRHRYLFQLKLSAHKLGMRYYRVVLRGRSGALRVSKVRGVHLHRPPTWLVDAAPDTRGSSTHQLRSANRSESTWADLAPSQLGWLQCGYATLQVLDGPSYVNTPGFAYWVPVAYHLGGDGQWRFHSVIGLQYNNTVNQYGVANTGWRSLATNDYSGSIELGTQPGNTWAVYNYVGDSNGTLVAGGWSHVGGSPNGPAFCTT